MNSKPLEAALRPLIGDSDRAIVVFSAIFPFARALGQSGEDASEVVLDALLEIAGNDRNLLMPTFTDGFRDGLIDLDKEPGTSGALGNGLLARPSARRTASAFFSYAVLGPDAGYLAALRPRDAWGDDSVYHWMAEIDARCVMLGVPTTKCSFSHYAEWRLRDRIPYRYVKEFHGTMLRDGLEQPLSERLFVRSLDPEAMHHLAPLEPVVEECGLRRESFNGVALSSVNAKALLDGVQNALANDPLMLLRNPGDFRPKIGEIGRQAVTTK